MSESTRLAMRLAMRDADEMSDYELEEETQIMDRVIRSQQRSKALLDTIQDGVWPELESEVRTLAEQQPPINAIKERYQYLRKYPLIGAAIMDYSAFYHRAYGAADVLNAYVTLQPTASEWHIHMANMSKETLMEIDESVVRNSVTFAMYKRERHPEELEHSFAKARQEVDQELGEHEAATHQG